MGDVADWMKRHAAKEIEIPPLFYMRRNMDGEIEQAGVVDGKFVTRKVSEDYCLRLAIELLKLIRK